MALDWNRLQPHRPLEPRDPRYVQRRASTALSLVQWSRSGRSTALVAGPVGTGKSTELAQAGEYLHFHTFPCLLPLDRALDLRRLSRDRLLATMAHRLAEVAGDLPLSAEARGAWATAARAEHGTLSQTDALDTLIGVAREVIRLSPQGRVVFLIDGLEKASREIANIATETLGELPDEVELVVVVPFDSAYGLRGEIIRPGERLFVHGAIPVADCDHFFRDLIGKRLATSWDELVTLVGDQAERQVAQLIEWSSGLPRDFLQLTADAATYAGLSRGADWPDDTDMAGARADFIESFRRALQPGDEAALLAVDGTDGRELALDRKLRMLAQGMLVEVTEPSGQKVMRPHNLLRPLLRHV